MLFTDYIQNTVLQQQPYLWKNISGLFGLILQHFSTHFSVCVWCRLHLLLSSVCLSLPSHSFFLPSFIYNRTWQGIISCIMKSSRPVIHTVTLHYGLLSLKTLNVNEATLWSVKVWVVVVTSMALNKKLFNIVFAADS